MAGHREEDAGGIFHPAPDAFRPVPYRILSLPNGNSGAYYFDEFTNITVAPLPAAERFPTLTDGNLTGAEPYYRAVLERIEEGDEAGEGFDATAFIRRILQGHPRLALKLQEARQIQRNTLHDLTLRRSFEAAKRESLIGQKFLVVNLHEKDEWADVNRGTWEHWALRETVCEKFVVLQEDRRSEDGKMLCQHFGLNRFPAVLVMDPVTGLKVNAGYGKLGPERMLQMLEMSLYIFYKEWAGMDVRGLFD